MKNKIILVTGASNGMGAAHARVLAREGARVIMGDVADDKGAALEADLKSADLDVTFRHLDVTSEDDWASLAQFAARDFGGLDGLVNNAGVVPGGSIEDTTLDEWQRGFAVNATGPFLGIKACAPVMRDSGGGSIVNISSVAGLRGTPSNSAYSASKAALIKLSQSAAISLAESNIRVNTVCPGSVGTERTKDIVSRVLLRTPMQRKALPTEISDAVVFLLSDRSTFITGTDLIVDGGFLAT
jgi:3alpha(or 20beta)-hydroxysteroid dehydrogenase